MNNLSRKSVDLSKEDFELFNEMAEMVEFCKQGNKLLYARGFEMYFEMFATGFIIPRHSIVRVILADKPNYTFVSYIVHDDGDLINLYNKEPHDPQAVLSLNSAPLGWHLLNLAGENLRVVN